MFRPLNLFHWTRQGGSIQSILGHWAHPQPHWTTKKGTRQEGSLWNTLRSIVKLVLVIWMWIKVIHTSERNRGKSAVTQKRCSRLHRLPKCMTDFECFNHSHIPAYNSLPPMHSARGIYHQHRIDCSNSFLPAHFSIYHQYQYIVDCKYQYKNWLQWLLPSCTSQYIPSIPVQNWLLQVFPSCTLSV